MLGIFGREGVFAAAMWPLGSTAYIDAAFAMFRNYDGQASTFGDTSISASTSDTTASSVYSSLDAASPTNLVVVAINKASASKVAGLTLTHRAALAGATVFTLTSSASTPRSAPALTAVAQNAFSYTMPARSISTLVFHP